MSTQSQSQVRPRLTSRILLAVYLAIFVAFLFVAYGSGEHRALAAGIDRLGPLGRLVSTGAQGTPSALPAAAFLLMLLPVDLLHSGLIMFRTRRLVPGPRFAALGGGRSTPPTRFWPLSRLAGVTC